MICANSPTHWQGKIALAFGSRPADQAGFDKRLRLAPADVDTRWLKKLGVEAAKDVLTLQEYHRVRNRLEDKNTKVRLPGGKFAETIFQ